MPHRKHWFQCHNLAPGHHSTIERVILDPSLPIAFLNRVPHISLTYCLFPSSRSTFSHNPDRRRETAARPHPNSTTDNQVCSLMGLPRIAYFLRAQQKPCSFWYCQAFTTCAVAPWRMRPSLFSTLAAMLFSVDPEGRRTPASLHPAWSLCERLQSTVSHSRGSRTLLPQLLHLTPPPRCRATPNSTLCPHCLPSSVRHTEPHSYHGKYC